MGEEYTCHWRILLGLVSVELAISWQKTPRAWWAGDIKKFGVN